MILISRRSLWLVTALSALLFGGGIALYLRDRPIPSVAGLFFATFVGWVGGWAIRVLREPKATRNGG
jgi:hypothetical protein